MNQTFSCVGIPRDSVRSDYALDAMRGLAAILVVFFHLGIGFGVPYPHSAYLAVDMFFALSGFVLAKKYDSAFANGLTVRSFMVARAVRLYPLYAVGTALGAISLALISVRSVDTLFRWAVATLFNAVLLPTPVLVRLWRCFPGDLAAWSLFQEFWVANLLFAVLWRRLNLYTLMIVITVAGAGLAIYASKDHAIAGGSHWPDIGGGFVRVFFSFFTGVALWRVHQLVRPPVSFPAWTVLLVLAAALCMPRPHHGGAYDLFCIGVLFPALIYFGAAAREKRPDIGRFCGNISYALYIIHAPIVDLAGWAHPVRGLAAIVVMVPIAILAIAVAWVAQKKIDPTLRRWFAARQTRGLSAASTPEVTSRGL